MQAFTQAGVDGPWQTELPGHGVGGLAGAQHVAAHDAADGLLPQPLCGGGGLLLAGCVQGFAAVLEDARRIAGRLAVAQEIEAVAGAVKQGRQGRLAACTVYQGVHAEVGR